MSLGALVFLSPWLLAALMTLPLIYWLLRAVPPRPKQVAFPPTRILAGLENPEKTPAKTPWWLLLLRLLAAALVILALAEPILNPGRDMAVRGSGPLVLVVDNGWASAPQWAVRQTMLERLIAEAEAQNRPIVIVATASATRPFVLRLEGPREARATAATLMPQPFAPTRLELLPALKDTLGGATSGVNAVWLADGLDHDGTAAAFIEGLANLMEGGRIMVLEDPVGLEPLGLVAGIGGNGKLEATLLRTGGSVRPLTIQSFSGQGQPLGEVTLTLDAGASSAKATLELPLELRNQVARLEISGERSAGAVSLLDARSTRNRVGLVSGESREQAQPLLAPLYYIRKALGPFSELVEPKDSNLTAAISSIFAEKASVLVLADIGVLSGQIGRRVNQWVQKGGILVRFAGPRLEKGGDDLMPAPLRLGGRTLGGALSWAEPQPLAPFEPESLFAGLDVPADVMVTRQVLADPVQLTSDVEVWARLKDGTPLVTSRVHGDGRIVLFHVTANADWSNLPISGLFVEMLRRITNLGIVVPYLDEEGETVAAGAPVLATPAMRLAPIQALDGYGVLKAPPPIAQAVALADLATLIPSSVHPPGYYGTGSATRALNVLRVGSVLSPLSALPLSVSRQSFASEAPMPLKPWMLGAALLLIFIDIVATMLLQIGGFKGLGSSWRYARRTAVVLLMAGAFALGGVNPADAQSTAAPRRPDATPSMKRDDIARLATSKVTFGYVLTGDAQTDQTSHLGLSGLGRVLATRTAVEPGEPMPVNIATDEIAFYPVLYWPVLPDAAPLDEATIAKIDAYMKQGGMIVFDTRDFGQGVPTGTSLRGQETPLQRLLSKLDIPLLEPVPPTHVLTKSFYLLRSFPGRWDGGQLWVETSSEDAVSGDTKARQSDGVSAILVTSNDLAAAWARDTSGRPIYPVTPGGEMQREMAYRTGINIVMHALTGNYKADQVHIPELLERLGQ